MDVKMSLEVSKSFKKEVGFEGTADPKEETKKAGLPSITKAIAANNDSLPLIDRAKNTTPILDLEEVIQHEGKLVLDAGSLENSVLHPNGGSAHDLSKSVNQRNQRESSPGKARGTEAPINDVIGLRETAIDGNEFPK